MIKLKFLTILLMFNLSLVSNLNAVEEEKVAIVMGRVTNDYDNSPIVKATVLIGDNFDFTDVDGVYRIKGVPYGQKQTMKIMKEGINLYEVDIEVNQPYIKHNVSVNPVEPLIAALKDENSDVQQNAVWALTKIGIPAVQSLVDTFKNKDEDLFVRRKVAMTLAMIKDPCAVKPLIDTLNDKDEDSTIRTQAVVTLGAIKDSRAVEPLINILKDEDSNVREHAAEALGEIKDPRAVEPLIDVLKDEDSNVREHAAEALGEIKDPRAVEPLIAVLIKKEVLFVQKAAERALRMITGENFERDPVRWRTWWEENKEKFSR